MYQLPKTSGARIRAIREDKGQSKNGLANSLGIAPKTIWRLENDRNSIGSYSTIKRIANELQVPPVNFFKKRDIDAFVSGWDPKYDGIHDEAGAAASRNDESLEVFKFYSGLPAVYQDKSLRISFKNSDSWRSTEASITTELSDFGLENGATVQKTCWDIDIAGKPVGWTTIYAVNEIAFSLLNEIAPDVTVFATAKTVFGTIVEQQSAYHEAAYKNLTGVVITEIERTTKTQNDNGD